MHVLCNKTSVSLSDFTSVNFTYINFKIFKIDTQDDNYLVFLRSLFFKQYWNNNLSESNFYRKKQLHYFSHNSLHTKLSLSNSNFIPFPFINYIITVSLSKIKWFNINDSSYLKVGNFNLYLTSINYINGTITMMIDCTRQLH